MNQIKIRVAGAILLILLIVSGGWFLGIEPPLATASSANQERMRVNSFNNVNELFLAKLRRDYQNITALQSQLNLLHVSVPTTANLSKFISELNSLASKENVTVKLIQFNDAKPYSFVGQTPGAAGNQEPPPPLSNSKITSTNFVVIPMQISVTGIYSDVLDFLNAVQRGPRLCLITTLSTTGSTGAKAIGITPPLVADFSGRVDASIGGYIYVLLE